MFVFFFKQKTAYEVRISDWISDVCSSDLDPEPARRIGRPAPADPQLLQRSGRLLPSGRVRFRGVGPSLARPRAQPLCRDRRACRLDRAGDRKSVVKGKRVSDRVDLGGRRLFKNKKTK